MYSIQTFVLEMMRERGIKKSEFIKRCGYSNITKGCKRFDDFIHNVDYNKHLIDHLHLGLEISKDIIDEKLRVSKIEIQKDLDEEKDRADIINKANFVPYLYCQTENRFPSSIWVCAIMRADLLKKITLPVDFNTMTKREQSAAIKNAILKTMKRHDGIVPTFGRIVCFTLERHYNEADQMHGVYDVKGYRVKNPDDAYKKIIMGNATLSYKGHNLMQILRMF